MSGNNDLQTIINEGYGESAQTPDSIAELQNLLRSWFPSEKNFIALKRNAEKLIRQLKAYYAKHADEDETIAQALKNVTELIAATQPKQTHSSSESSNSDDSGDDVRLPSSNHYDSDSHSTSSGSVNYYGTFINNVKNSAQTFNKRQSGKFIAGILNVIASIALNIAALAVLAASGGALIIPALGLAAGGTILGATGLGLLFSSKRISKTLSGIAHLSHQESIKNKQK